MTSPLVSVALCTYNGEKFLIEQLESIINQTYGNLELVVVDDCSTDRTIDILKKYQLKKPDIRIFQNEKNLGYTKNFEKAITLCTGNLIALSDQDDIWDVKKIQLLVDAIEDNDAIYHDSEMVDQQGNVLNKKISDVFNMFEGATPLPFLFYNCVSGHALMFKRSLIDTIIPFPDSFYHDCWIAFISTSNGSLKYENKILVKYRQHLNSSTDLLKIKKEQKKRTKGSTDINLDWLINCAQIDSPYTYIVKKIIACFDENGKTKHRIKLLFLLLANFKYFFYVKKKSNINKLNYIRKMCFE